jgi:hypothetical protein
MPLRNTCEYIGRLLVNEEHLQENRDDVTDPDERSRSAESGMTPRGKYTLLFIGVAFFSILVCMCLSIFALVAV